VKLAFRLPNGPEVGVVGAWQVTAIEGDLVLATPVGEGSTPAVGHAAMIDSASPAPRVRAPEPSPALAPGAPGSPRAPGPASPLQDLTRPQATTRAPDSAAARPAGRPWLGVTIGPVPDKAIAGAAVVEVLPGSPGERGGLDVQDIVVRYDGRPVRNPAELGRLVAATAVGATVDVVVVRAGAERVVRLTIGARPTEP
jgi:membrane-associated protease RseP (regulator of RpoE activity)